MEIWLKRSLWREFPGSPVLRTLRRHCWGLEGLGSIPGQGTKILQAALATGPKTNKNPENTHIHKKGSLCKKGLGTWGVSKLRVNSVKWLSERKSGRNLEFRNHKKWRNLLHYTWVSQIPFEITYSILKGSCSVMSDSLQWDFWHIKSVDNKKNPLMFPILSLASCGMCDLALRPGVEAVPLALEAWNLNHWTTREVPPILLWWVKDR